MTILGTFLDDKPKQTPEEKAAEEKAAADKAAADRAAEDERIKGLVKSATREVLDEDDDDAAQKKGA